MNVLCSNHNHVHVVEEKKQKKNHPKKFPNEGKLWLSIALIEKKKNKKLNIAITLVAVSKLCLCCAALIMCHLTEV